MTISLERHTHLQGWVASAIFHGMAMMVVALFVSAVKPLPESPVFRWDVSLVKASESVQPAAALRTLQPAAAAQPQSERRPVTESQQVHEVRHVIEGVAQVVESPPAMQRSAAVQRDHAVVTGPAERRSVETVSNAAVSVERASRNNMPETATHRALPRNTPVEDSYAIHTSDRAVESRIESRPDAARVTTEIKDVTSLPVAAESTSHSAIDSRVEFRSDPAAVIQEIDKAVSRDAVEPRSESVTRTIRSSLPVKADYGWLVESLAARLAEVKHYPATARLNGWQGKVVLRAVIRADGHLADVVIGKSSGHPALDEAAKDALRQACPIPMRYELGRPDIAINVPVLFQLSN